MFAREGDRQLPPCRSFPAFAHRLERATRTQIRAAVHKLEMAMLTQFLRSDDQPAVHVRAFNTPDFTPEDLHLGLTACRLADLAEDDGHG